MHDDPFNKYLYYHGKITYSFHMHARLGRKIKIVYYDHLFCIFSIIRDNVKIPTWEHKQIENPLFCIVRIIHGKGDICIKVDTSNALNHINVPFSFISCIIYLFKKFNNLLLSVSNRWNGKQIITYNNYT